MRHERGGAHRPRRRTDAGTSRAVGHPYLRAVADHRAHTGSASVDAALHLRRNRLSIIGGGLMRNISVWLLLAVIPLLHGCVAAMVGGAATGVVMAEDRRTVGTITEDQGIELKSASRLDDKLRSSHINVTSYNRTVLITGEVANAASKEEAERIVRGVENVR